VEELPSAAVPAASGKKKADFLLRLCFFRIRTTFAYLLVRCSSHVLFSGRPGEFNDLPEKLLVQSF
jgi:hypothetical protein